MSRGVQYVLSIMRKCIMVKLGRKQKKMQYASLAYGDGHPWKRVHISESVSINVQKTQRSKMENKFTSPTNINFFEGNW